MTFKREQKKHARQTQGRKIQAMLTLTACLSSCFSRLASAAVKRAMSPSQPTRRQSVGAPPMVPATDAFRVASMSVSEGRSSTPDALATSSRVSGGLMVTSASGSSSPVVGSITSMTKMELCAQNSAWFDSSCTKQYWWASPPRLPGWKRVTKLGCGKHRSV